VNPRVKLPLQSLTCCSPRYWDWTQDSHSFKRYATSVINSALYLPQLVPHSRFLASPIFSPTTGFGSPGSGPLNHVPNGPFSGLIVALGPGNIVNTHPLTRILDETMLRYLTAEYVDNTTRQPTFELFRITLEGRPVTEGIKIHDGGHNLIGGDMGDTYSSPGGALHFVTSDPDSGYARLILTASVIQTRCSIYTTPTSTESGGCGKRRICQTA